MTEVPSDTSALDVTKERLAVIQRMAREGATDAACETCQGTGIDPDPPDTDGPHDQCPECKGAGTVEQLPAPPAGLSTPPIDHDKVTAAAEALTRRAIYSRPCVGHQDVLADAGEHQGGPNGAERPED